MSELLILAARITSETETSSVHVDHNSQPSKHVTQSGCLQIWQNEIP